MEKLKKAGQVAYGIGLAGMVLPQFFYRVFGPNFLPPWPGLPWITFWVYVFTTVVLIACIAIIFKKKPRTASLILGALLLLMYIFGDIPYELIIDPQKNDLMSWTAGLTGLAIAGGAFVMAGSFPHEINIEKSGFLKSLEKLIPLGSICFCITMILYGLCHFLYTKSVSTLIPAWVPGPMFWTYFAGAALMAAGFAIVFRFKLNITALLLGGMIFLWFIVLHIPRAIADPFSNNFDEPISALSALAFSGIAFVIAAGKPRAKSPG